MPPVTGGEAVVRSLAAHGVTTVFGIPGTHNLPIYAALDDYGIGHVLPRHEQGAGYAADGHARVTGRPGVVVTTTGPALLNAATAAAQAYSDSVPVLLVSPGMPLEHPGSWAGELHEVKDQSGAMDRIVASSHRVTSVAEIPAAVAAAFARMGDRRPRPVHLEVPLDLLEVRAEAVEVAPIGLAGDVAEATGVDKAAGELAGSERPGLIVGGGARTAGGEVRALAERLGAPVVTSTNGKGVLAEDHPLSVGAGLHHPSVRAFLSDCDRVVAIGTELAPADTWESLDLDGRLVRIDVDADQLLRPCSPRVAVLGRAQPALERILGRLSDPPGHPDGTARAQRWRRAHREDAAREGGPWLGLLDALHDGLGRDGIVVGDSAMVCYYGALSNLPRYTPASFLYPTGLGTLGYAVPAAVGAKLGRPDVDVVALSGDGGLMFTLAELAAAAQLELALPVVVVDNGGYGEIDRGMRERGQRSIGVDLAPADLPAAARALGCHGQDLDDLAALGPALAAALAADRPTLLRIPESATGAANWEETP